MGCSESKVEKQEAVALCRARTDLLEAAIHHRAALADAHAAYSDSLLSVSAALHRLLVLLLPPSYSSSPASPVLPPPVCRKPEPCPPPSLVSSGRHSHQDSRVSFLPADSCYNGDDGTPFYSCGSSPVDHLDHRKTVPSQRGFGSIHYARSRPPPPSVVFERPPQSYQTVQVGSFEPYADFPGYYGSLGGSFGPPAMPPPRTMASSALGKSYSSRATPPPPSPPRTSTWDLLNLFETDNNSYYRHTPSPNYQKLRDEEGIPDLEEEDQQVRMEAYREYVEEGSKNDHSRPPASEVADKNVVADEVQKRRDEQRNVASPKKFLRDSAVARAIKTQFERLSQCARELSELLEIRDHHYHPAHSLYEDDKAMGYRSLASTLRTLYNWERKLYHEVRAEEKMRLQLNKSHKELTNLVKSGGNPHKIDSTEKLINNFSTKIGIAIQVVESISGKINKLRNEELWPQITELILRLIRMWNVMLECHHMQCLAISEAKRSDLDISSGKLSDDHADETMQLEMEILKWISNFSAWVNAQRNYVKALNGWLLLYLHHEPEETADGVTPYSPRRIGAPLVFIVGNCWSQAMDWNSEREVLDAMQASAAAIHDLWEQQNIEPNERTIAIRDRDTWLRALKQKSKNIHREIDSLKKKLAIVPGHSGLPVYQWPFKGHTARLSSVQLSLEMIFEAMKDFSASSVKAYGELLQHCGEQRIARENVKAPFDSRCLPATCMEDIIGQKVFTTFGFD
ncbi:protein ALTERED PHOSPHATE STARVATION RESPONSE 1-like [Musa acuminata AAA Group]|uniref:protein ALTERED PHOSPHATE STARVATION RESPONSE 1-like n=1 Tax=Musa acuminata AAA Group TaxID=214697 RepID=UPI0031D1FF68